MRQLIHGGEVQSVGIKKDLVKGVVSTYKRCLHAIYVYGFTRHTANNFSLDDDDVLSCNWLDVAGACQFSLQQLTRASGQRPKAIELADLVC